MKRFLRQWICVLPAGRGVWFWSADLSSMQRPLQAELAIR